MLLLGKRNTSTPKGEKGERGKEGGMETDFGCSVMRIPSPVPYSSIQSIP